LISTEQCGRSSPATGRATTPAPSALDRWFRYFAKGIAIIINVQDPDVILVGGDEVKFFIDVAKKITDFFDG